MVGGYCPASQVGASCVFEFPWCIYDLLVWVLSPDFELRLRVLGLIWCFCVLSGCSSG